MKKILELAQQIAGIDPALQAPADVAAAIGVLEQLSLYLPEPAGRLASIALLLARDLALAGKGPEDLEALRSAVRSDWQAALDRFPRG
jgi:hypothetical protein